MQYMRIACNYFLVLQSKTQTTKAVKTSLTAFIVSVKGYCKQLGWLLKWECVQQGCATFPIVTVKHTEPTMSRKGFSLLA